jgi:hypothetical protein
LGIHPVCLLRSHEALVHEKHVSGEAATIDNVITLSDQFWDEIREHPIPADLNVVRWSMRQVVSIFIFGSFGAFSN